MKKAMIAIMIGALTVGAAGSMGKEEEPVKMIPLLEKRASYDLYCDADGVLYVKTAGKMSRMVEGAGKPMTYEPGKEAWG